MTKQLNPVCYHLPDLDTTIIDSWNALPIALTANDAVATYPNIFWLEADSEGTEHLCCAVVDLQQYPKIDTTGGVYKAIDFVVTMESGIIEGGCWHPVRKPPRPLL